MQYKEPEDDTLQVLDPVDLWPTKAGVRCKPPRFKAQQELPFQCLSHN